MISKKKKKKGLHQNSGRFFFQNFASSNVSGGALFAWGGLFLIFHRKSASKAQKTCDFACFTSQWGGLEPPPAPPLATLLGTRDIMPNAVILYSFAKTRFRFSPKKHFIELPAATLTDKAHLSFCK